MTPVDRVSKPAPLPATSLATLPRRASPRLLVSVRDANEARLAKRLQVDWIDLKDPDAGSLGAASEPMARAVAQELTEELGTIGRLTGGLRSAAVGELRDAPRAQARMLAGYFPVIKVGLSGLQGSRQWPGSYFELSSEIDSLGAQLVPVIYADYQVCLAPRPMQVVEAAADWDRSKPAANQPRYLLIDTYTKEGRRLLDWLPLPELEEIVRQAIFQGREVVLAGSLNLLDVPILLKLPVAAIAIRGAVCGKHRRSEICPKKLSHWVELFRNT